MGTYRRPAIEVPPILDQHGAVTPYGHRWGGGSPPENSYSVTSHLERFAPLQAIAQGLIDHLAGAYEVDVDDDLRHADTLIRRRHDVLRSVRLTPDDPDAAALTFVFTTFPSVVVHAGLLHDFYYPLCGCDACDENWQQSADRLEQDVAAIVSGGYRESVSPGRHTWVEYGLQLPGGQGSHGGRTSSDGYPNDKLGPAAARLGQLPEGWAAWTPR